jgi:NAD(P)H-flavin reductase/quinol-cytochrome oxidoreductase complex cytochrome b subunit/ferredoxin
MKRLQSLLQWAFMRLEALFNAAFGDRLNPLYHLGAISFFLFWVVGASGLYLYAFFETGVADAYGSVQALTHGQWWAGGILRSVHRYASDAMVLTMLLHMLRHFAFDRFHGFRWFSWLTGVALIWLVYASGINGYMLPWDRLAQFVIVTSFEWLDWLPMFSGTLMRNFVHADSVGDRFFSLLSFIHIGLPLVVLLLMWVHVQRVPRARTTPPRTIVASLLLTLLALALAQPAVSQGGPANLATAVSDVRLDWFYLALFPLLVAWPLGQVWALLGAGTAALAALPWWPPALARGKPRPRQVVVHGSAGAAVQFTLRDGETLLDAGLREGLALPFECRNGGCGVCVCSVEHGEVAHRPYQASVLPDAARARGKALMCCAVPRGDVVIEVETFSAAAGRKALEHVGRVAAMERLAEDVMCVRIDLPDGHALAFHAGQYVNILLDDGQRRAFSFANPPHENTCIELHVRRIPGGRFTGHVFDGMRVGDTLRFEGPLGDFTLREGTRPILFVAGATGFAPIKSIVEDAWQRGLQRPMRLYWGVRRRGDLYLLELARQWERTHANFRVVPVLSEPQPQDAWTGRTGLVHEAMLADLGDLAGYEVYVCGSVKMVEAAVPAFIAQGLGDGACFSDAFAPAAAQ